MSVGGTRRFLKVYRCSPVRGWTTDPTILSGQWQTVQYLRWKDGRQVTQGSGFRDVGIEAGIPTLSSFERGKEKALKLRKLGFLGTIHVSVNAAGRTRLTKTQQDELLEQGIRASFHAHNIGLYGNFRFLADACEEKYFFWLPLDDCPPLELFSYLQSNARFGLDFDLMVCNHSLIETQDPSDEDCLSCKDSLGESPFRENSPFSPDPSGIFGVWRSRWLKEIFPHSYFDWLDTYILSKTALSGNIFHLDATRGIGFDPNRVPHSVNGSYHSPNGWILRTLLLALRHRQARGLIRAVLGRLHYSATSLRWAWQKPNAKQSST